MNNKRTIPDTAVAWENGRLGRSAAHVRAADPALEQAVDESLGLQAISIRVPKATIEAYKIVGAHYGKGYQPLMRDAMQRWVQAELKQIQAKGEDLAPLASASQSTTSRLRRTA
jgi:hypothetical protein